MNNSKSVSKCPHFLPESAKNTPKNPKKSRKGLKYGPYSALKNARIEARADLLWSIAKQRLWYEYGHPELIPESAKKLDPALFSEYFFIELERLLVDWQYCFNRKRYAKRNKAAAAHSLDNKLHRLGLIYSHLLQARGKQELEKRDCPASMQSVYEAFDPLIDKQALAIPESDLASKEAIFKALESDLMQEVAQ